MDSIDLKDRARIETTASPYPLIWNSFRVTAISAMQVLVFIVIYEASVEIYISKFGAMNKLFGFGMQMDNGTYLLSILAGINTLAQIFIEKLGIRLGATVICGAVWISYWGNIANEVPNRFMLLSVLGMVSFAAGVLLSFRADERRYG